MMTASRLALGLVALILAGCQNTTAERDPLPYSPNYHMADTGGPVRKGYETRSGRLVPDACVTPDVAADPLYLPPGCANNVNLQMMVEREGDLVRGRDTGPAMAAPAARAARRVIDGNNQARDTAGKRDVSTTELTE